MLTNIEGDVVDFTPEEGTEMGQSLTRLTGGLTEVYRQYLAPKEDQQVVVNTVVPEPVAGSVQF